VRRVSVAVARRTGGGCRFLRPGGALGPKTSCARTRYLTAGGTSTWRLRVHHRLPAGSYVAWVRAVDAAGNVERKQRSRNATHLRVR
jgi:hypothetical protein